MANFSLTTGMVQRQARVVKHFKVAKDHYQLSLHCPEAVRRAQPGQFIHLLCPGNGDGPLLLRRPFSLFDVDLTRGTLDFIYKVVGSGTHSLQAVKVGQRLDLLGPLGSTFEVHPETKNILLVGGGFGIPPLYYLAKALLENSRRFNAPTITAFLGARTRHWVIANKAFKQLGVRTLVATDDGTMGHKGTTIDLVKRFLKKVPDRTALYTCGPTPMMAAAARLAKQKNLFAQASLEERMGCAMGVCMGCVVEIKGPHATTHKKYQRVCTEGPVFAADAVVWDK